MQALAMLPTHAYVRTVARVGEALDAMAHHMRAREGQTAAFHWGWVVLIGIFVIAAAIAWATCRASGYAGFSGTIVAERGPFGIQIGIRLYCF